MVASATWLELCVFANLPRKFRFSLLITGAGRVIFFNPIQLHEDSRIRIPLNLFLHFSREMNWVCSLLFFFFYFLFCMHGGHNLMPQCNVEETLCQSCLYVYITTWWLRESILSLLELLKSYTCNIQVSASQHIKESTESSSFVKVS